jgi:hypothetical protein
MRAEMPWLVMAAIHRANPAATWESLQLMAPLMAKGAVGERMQVGTRTPVLLHITLIGCITGLWVLGGLGTELRAWAWVQPRGSP